MLRTYLIAVAVRTTAMLPAQQVDWLQSDPVVWSLNPSMPEHTIASAPGYLVAMRTEQVSIGGSLDVFGTVVLERSDPVSGTSLWGCLIGDSVSVAAAVVDANGMAYFAGQFKEDQLEICDGTTLPYVGNAIDENAFLIAWDLEANEMLWVKNMTAEVGGWHRAAALAIGPDGAIWYALSDFFEGVIFQLDAGGNILDTRVVGNAKTIGAISFDPWGGMYVSGGTDNSGVTFSGNTYPSSFDYAMYVLRYAPDGSAGFVEYAQDITFQEPRVVATDDGHAYLAGNVFNATVWGGFPVNGADWVNAVFIAKLDSTGTFHWLVESDPPSGSLLGDVEAAKGPCIAIDQNNNVYFTGTLRGQVDWGSGVVSDGLTTGTRTLTVVAFNAEGGPQWTRTSSPAGSVWAQAITAMAEPGVLHFQGHITSQFSMDGQTTNSGGAQAAALGRISGLPTVIEPINNADKMKVWPNPTTDVLHVHSEKVQPAVLYNSAGKQVQRMLLLPDINTINIGILSEGIYLLRLDDGRSKLVMKE